MNSTLLNKDTIKGMLKQSLEKLGYTLQDFEFTLDVYSRTGMTKEAILKEALGFKDIATGGLAGAKAMMAASALTGATGGFLGFTAYDKARNTDKAINDKMQELLTMQAANERLKQELKQKQLANEQGQI